MIQGDVAKLFSFSGGSPSHSEVHRQMHNKIATRQTKLSMARGNARPSLVDPMCVLERRVQTMKRIATNMAGAWNLSYMICVMVQTSFVSKTRCSSGANQSAVQKV